MIALVAVFTALLLAASTEVGSPQEAPSRPLLGLIVPLFVPLVWVAIRLLTRRAPPAHQRRLTILYFYLGFVAAYAVLLFPAGWGHWVLFRLGWDGEQLWGQLLLLAPAALTAIWLAPWIYWNLPPRTVGTPRGLRPFLGWAVARFRLVTLPLAVYCAAIFLLEGLQSIPGWEIAFDLYPTSGVVLTLGGVVALFLTLPYCVLLAWPSKPLPPGPIRERLEELTNRSGLRLREIRVWTRDSRHTVNACVMGHLPRARQVIFTEGACRLLTTNDLAAIFGHELGHVARRHLWWYLALMTGFLLSLAPLHHWFVTLGEVWGFTAFFVYVVVWWGFYFGFLSRRFELEADRYAADLVGTQAYLHTFANVGLLLGDAIHHGGWRHFSLKKRFQVVRESTEPSSPHRLLLARSCLRLKWITVGLLVISAIAYGSTAYWEFTRKPMLVARECCMLYLERADRLAVLIDTPETDSALQRSRRVIETEYRRMIQQAQACFDHQARSSVQLETEDELPKRLTAHWERLR